MSNQAALYYGGTWETKWFSSLGSCCWVFWTAETKLGSSTESAKREPVLTDIHLQLLSTKNVQNILCYVSVPVFRGSYLHGAATLYSKPTRFKDKFASWSHFLQPSFPPLFSALHLFFMITPRNWCDATHQKIDLLGKGDPWAAQYVVTKNDGYIVNLFALYAQKRNKEENENHIKTFQSTQYFCLIAGAIYIWKQPLYALVLS